MKNNFSIINSIKKSGKWSEEEECYAKKLIAAFENGSLDDCEDGRTLRSYLAMKLNCAPMRISKKFAGQSIGKCVFTKNTGCEYAKKRKLDDLLNCLDKGISGRSSSISSVDDGYSSNGSVTPPLYPYYSCNPSDPHTITKYPRKESIPSSFLCDYQGPIQQQQQISSIIVNGNDSCYHHYYYHCPPPLPPLSSLPALPPSPNCYDTSPSISPVDSSMFMNIFDDEEVEKEVEEENVLIEAAIWKDVLCYYVGMDSLLEDFH